MPRNKKVAPAIVEREYDISTKYNYKKKDRIIQINSTVPFMNVCVCINNIVNTVVNDSEYHPYFYDVAFFGSILEAFTDFDTSIGFEELSSVLSSSDLIEVVNSNISERQLELIKKSVGELIEFKKQKLINKSELDALANDIRGLVAKFDNVSDTDTFSKAINNLSSVKVTEKGIVNALVKASGIKKSKSTTKGKTTKANNDNVIELPLDGDK